MKHVLVIITTMVVMPMLVIGCTKTASDKKSGSKQEETKAESNKKLKIEGVGDNFKIEGVGKDFKIQSAD
jgi:hypothetical protein